MLFASLETMIQAGCGLAMPGCRNTAVAPSGLVQPDEPWLQQHERGAAMGRDRPSVQWLKAGARQLCQAGSVQSQHGCACTPELLLVRSTQVHSTEMLE